MAERDVLLSINQLNAGDFDAYEATRATYFDSRATPYNRKHYDRLIERIQVGLLRYDQRIVPDFGRQAFMLDLLPWWSSNVSAIEPGNCGLELPPLAAWKTVVDMFINELEPLAIIINGSTYAEWAEELFATTLQRFVYYEREGERRLHRLYAAYGQHPSGIPILMHGQLNYQSGPQSDELYEKMLAEWQTHSGIDVATIAKIVRKPSQEL